MKYLFLDLRIHNGEYRYSAKSVHSVNKRSKLTKFADNYAKTFYGGKAEKAEHGNGDAFYYFNGGEVAVEANSVMEITQEEYETLKKFL